MKLNLLLLFILTLSFTGLSKELVYVAKEQRTLYERDIYLYELLEHAFVAAEFPVQLEHIKVHPHQQRTLMALGRGQVDIHWSMGTPLREKLAIAIKIPLFKGHIGKRILIINRAMATNFESINSLEQLSKLVAVQGHDWPDTKIMAHNGLTVKPVANYQAMFDLIATHKADYFPRSIIEAESEILAQKNPALMILPNFYLDYSAEFYFFVNKEKPLLAKQLELGLKKLQASGEFDRLFERYIGKAAPTGKMLKLDLPY